MDKKSLKVKIFLNFYGTYKLRQNVCLLYTTAIINTTYTQSTEYYKADISKYIPLYGVYHRDVIKKNKSLCFLLKDLSF